MKDQIYCDVAFPIPVPQEYTYYLTEVLQKNIIGCRAVVDFGKQKDKVGVIVGIKKQINNNLQQIKPIKYLLDAIPLFDDEQLLSAKMFSKIYFVSLGMMLDAFFPIEKKVQIKQSIILRQKKLEISANFVNKSDEYQKIFKSKKDKILFIASTIQQKLQFYCSAIMYAIKNDTQMVILFPNNTYITDVWSYLIDSIGTEEIEKIVREKVAIYTGEVNIQERFKIWWLLRNKAINIVIATKIGAFLPLQNVSFVIIDEPDSLGFKNQEAPLYNSFDVLLKRSEVLKYKMILVSFIPSIKLWYNYKNRNMKIKSGNICKKNTVEIKIVTRDLKNVIERNFFKFRQTIIIYPYKGFSRYYMCLICKKIIPFSKIKNKQKFVCIHCGGKQYVEYGTGIKKFVEILRSSLKNVVIEYIDADFKQNKIRNIITDFNNGKIDVLVTTLVLLEHLYYLKLENVHTIYFAYMDGMLYHADYTSYETMYKIIHLFDVLLRSWRTEKSEICLELFRKENYNDVLLSNYNLFYRKELLLRKELCYPPYCWILKISLVGNKKNCVNEIAEKINTKLTQLEDVYVFVPSDVRLEGKKYELTMIIKLLKKDNELLDKVANVLQPITIEKKDVKMYVDYDLS